MNALQYEAITTGTVSGIVIGTVTGTAYHDLRSRVNSRSQLYSGTVYSCTAVQPYRSREILQLVGDSIEQDQIRKSASTGKCMRMYAHKTIA